MPYSLGELALAATGVGLAASATAFAAVMIADANRAPTFSGAEHLMIFARPASSSAGKAQARRTVDPSPADVDDMPVGSINPRPQGSPGEPPPSSARRSETPVRGIFNGKALIEAPTGFVLVEPGSRLPHLGMVVAIEPRGERWVIVTTSATASAEP